MTRNQSKKQKQVESNLKVGDRVVTRMGMIGRIVDIGDRTTKLEIAPGVNIQVLKNAIEGIDTPPDTKDAKDKDAKDAKDKDAKDAKDKDAKDAKDNGAKEKSQEKKA